MSQTRSDDEYHQLLSKIKSDPNFIVEYFTENNISPFSNEQLKSLICAVTENEYFDMSIAVERIPKYLLSKDLINVLLDTFPSHSEIILSKFPVELFTTDICLKALNGNTDAIKQIPPEIATEEMYMIVIKDSDTLTRKYIPIERMTKALSKEALRCHGNFILSFIPTKHLDEDDYIEAIKLGSLTLNKICEFRKDELSHKMCLVAVSLNGAELLSIPPHMLDETICMTALTQLSNGSFMGELNINAVFITVPHDIKTDIFYEKVLALNGKLLRNVPDEIKSIKFCHIAVKNDGNALQYVPTNLLSEELCIGAVKQNPQALKFVPDQFKSKQLCLGALKEDIRALFFIPSAYITEEVYIECIKQHPDAILAMPKEFMNEKMYQLAIKHNAACLEYIPESKRTYALCEKAVDASPSVLAFVPNKIKTYEMCFKVVERTGILHNVPEDYMDEKICMIATKVNGLSLSNVPNKNKYPLELFINAVGNNAAALEFVPEDRKFAVIETIKAETILRDNITVFDYFPAELQNKYQQIKDDILKQAQHIVVIANADKIDHELRDIYHVYANDPKRKNKTIYTDESRLNDVLTTVTTSPHAITLALVGHANPDSTSIADIDVGNIVTILENNENINSIALLGCNSAKSKMPVEEWRMIQQLDDSVENSYPNGIGFLASSKPLEPKDYEECFKQVAMDAVGVLMRTGQSQPPYKLLYLQRGKDNHIFEKSYEINETQLQEIKNYIMKGGKSPIPKDGIRKIRFNSNPLSNNTWQQIVNICQGNARFIKSDTNYHRDKKRYPFLNYFTMSEAEAEKKLEKSLLKIFFEEISTAQKEGRIKQDITLKGYANSLHVDVKQRAMIVTRTHLYPKTYTQSMFHQNKENIEVDKMTTERKQTIEKLKNLQDVKSSKQEVDVSSKQEIAEEAPDIQTHAKAIKVHISRNKS